MRGLTEGQVDIGLLMCLKSTVATRVMEMVTAISASFDSDAYLSVLSMTGVSDKRLQEVEVQIIKNKGSGDGRA